MTPEQKDLFAVSICVWNTLFAIFTVYHDNNSNSGCPNFRSGFLFFAAWISGGFLLPFIAIGGVFWTLGKLINGVKK